jgi:hypothetical protein
MVLVPHLLESSLLPNYHIEGGIVKPLLTLRQRAAGLDAASAAPGG